MTQHLRKPPEIEELSEVTWRRIENDVFARLDLDEGTATEIQVQPRRWAWPMAIGSFAVAAAVLALVLARPGSAPRELRTSRIVTADAPSEVSVGNADLVVKPRSAIFVTSHAERVEVLLERGGADFQVAPRRDDAPFIVRAGDVRVQVVGTAFAVNRVDHSAEVIVHEGVVQVVRRGEIALVRAGERWPADEVAATEMEMEPQPIRVRERKRRKAARATKKEKPAPAREDNEVSDTDARSLYESAARLEASDPAAAVALYRQVATSGGAWAAPALYAQGRLEIDRGRIQAGRRLLASYLDRFPGGANAADAQALLDESRR